MTNSFLPSVSDIHNYFICKAMLFYKHSDPLFFQKYPTSDLLFLSAQRCSEAWAYFGCGYCCISCCDPSYHIYICIADTRIAQLLSTHRWSRLNMATIMKCFSMFVAEFKLIFRAAVTPLKNYNVSAVCNYVKEIKWWPWNGAMLS